MGIKYKIVVALYSFFIYGCVTHVTTDDFIKTYDYYLNEPFYTYEKNEYQHPIQLHNNMLRFNSIKYSNGCRIYWIVDPSVKKYKHPNGMIFDIEGIKKEWGFISDPALCQFEVKYRGALTP